MLDGITVEISQNFGGCRGTMKVPSVLVSGYGVPGTGQTGVHSLSSPCVLYNVGPRDSPGKFVERTHKVGCSPCMVLLSFQRFSHKNLKSTHFTDEKQVQEPHTIN